MAFITLANTNKIIYNSDLQVLNLKGEVYKIPIYFFSKYEENALLAIQELLKDPEKYFTEIYVPYTPTDTFTYIYEGQSPAYHKFSCCPRLKSDYQNFVVPKEIRDKGPEAVEEFRQWFESVKHLLNKPDLFVERLRLKYGIVANPKAINRVNSGSTESENPTIEKLEKWIDGLIKKAGRFYYKNEKNKTILKRFSKNANIAYKHDPIYSNNTKYTDEEIKDLLRHYDQEFKRPLKQHLIEYYRLKLNPNIKMEGVFLEKLGFRSCLHCHSSTYRPDSNSYQIDESFIESHVYFFSILFSIHYPFTNRELVELRDKIQWGGCVYSFFDADYGYLYEPSLGAIFNSSINWDNTLIEIADFECNHLAATWWNEDEIPLDKKRELTKNNLARMDYIYSTCSNADEFGELLSNHDIPWYDEDLVDKKYEEIKPQELMQMVDEYSQEMMFNETFYNSVVKCLMENIPDFDVLKFFEKYVKFES